MHFFDESFWVALSFLIFLFFAYRPVKKAIVNSLNARIEEINTKLLEAQQLKENARILLEEVEAELKHFEERKEKILKNAEASTAKLIENKTKEMSMQIDRMQKSAEDSIENTKNKATSKLSAEFIEHSLTLVREYLQETKNNSTNDDELVSHLLKSK